MGRAPASASGRLGRRGTDGRRKSVDPSDGAQGAVQQNPPKRATGAFEPHQTERAARLRPTWHRNRTPRKFAGKNKPRIEAARSVPPLRDSPRPDLELGQQRARATRPRHDCCCAFPKPHRVRRHGSHGRKSPRPPPGAFHRPMPETSCAQPSTRGWRLSALGLATRSSRITVCARELQFP